MADIVLSKCKDGMWCATKGKLIFTSPYSKLPRFKQNRQITIDDTTHFKSLEVLARELAVYAISQEPPKEQQ